MILIVLIICIFVVDHLRGKIEKINDSRDRYLVINEDSLMSEKI